MALGRTLHWGRIIQVVSATWRDLEYLPIRFEWTQTRGGPKLVCFCWVFISKFTTVYKQRIINFFLKFSGSDGGGAGSPSCCGACFCWIGFPHKHRRAKGFETQKTYCNCNLFHRFFWRMVPHGTWKSYDELVDKVAAYLGKVFCNLERKKTVASSIHRSLTFSKQC